MNVVFLGLVFVAFLASAFRQMGWQGSGVSPMESLTKAMVETAASSVTLALGLIGVMALFLGLMKVVEKGGLLVILARLIRPLMVRLFPEVPPDHPAMGAMILNMSANAMGLGNAATPFGIRAMRELDRLNPHEGIASNSMALFLAINTSSVTLLPTGVIALRASLGSHDPAAILPTTLFASFCSTLVAIVAAKGLQRFYPVSGEKRSAVVQSEALSGTANQEDDTDLASGSEGYPPWVSMVAMVGFVSMIPLTILFGREISPWVIPGLMVAMLGFGVMRGVSVYEAFVEGAREGFDVAVRIIPYLVAILVAVGMFRASGAMDYLIAVIAPWTEPLGLPAQALPMAFLRPLSGSGAYGVMTSLLQDPAIGPDSYIGLLVSTIQGSTETTFYVLAVYFGAVGIRRLRHTLVAALLADVAGVAAAVAICSWLFA